MRRWIAALLGMSGCVQLFDLEPPLTIETIEDQDGDLVPDSLDNCPDVANADQADLDHDRRGDACDDCPTSRPTRDRDGDGVDDACDTCLLGPEVDEDGDSAMDACDLCPVTPQNIQTDQDGDIIGDLCDAADAASINSTRFRFERFTAIDPSWPGAAGWVLAADQASIEPAGSTAQELTLAQPSDLVVAASVLFEIAADGQVGVALASDGLRCEARCQGGSCTLGVIHGGAMATMPVPSLTRATLWVSVIVPSFNPEGSFQCALFRPGQSPSTIGMNSTAVGQTVLVSATPGSRILGADLVR